MFTTSVIQYDNNRWRNKIDLIYLSIATGRVNKWFRVIKPQTGRIHPLDTPTEDKLPKP